MIAFDIDTLEGRYPNMSQKSIFEMRDRKILDWIPTKNGSFFEDIWHIHDLEAMDAAYVAHTLARL